MKSRFGGGGWPAEFPGARIERQRTIIARLEQLGIDSVLAVSTVVDPIARSRDPLTGGNACGMANHGHDITMTTRPGAQNAKTILDIVIRYALDEARQHFPV
jgi:hypothetical protein